MTDVRDRVLESRHRLRRGLFGTDVPRKEDDRLLCRRRPVHRRRRPGPHRRDGGRALPLPARPHRPDRRVDAARALSGVLEVLIGGEVAARSGPIGILRPVPEAPAIPHFALAERDGHLRGPAGGQRRGHQPARRRGRARADRDRVRAAAARVRRDLGHGARRPGHPPRRPRPRICSFSNPQGSGDVAARFLEADVVVEGRFFINRVTGLPMETRAVLAEWRPGARELTVHASTQAPHLIRNQLAESLRMDEGDIRVVTSDVGGGFGMKLGAYPEDVLACLHAMSLRRPSSGSRTGTSTSARRRHGRESVHDYRIGARADGRILAMTDVYTNDLGGLNSPFGVLAAVHGRLQRALQGGGRLRRAPHRRHEQDADRRLPRLRPAGGQLRLRAADGQAGPAPRHRPGRAAGDEHGASPTSCPG